MTRTERNQYPAALLKDRHSRAAQPQSEQGHKNGAGPHNWGSYDREGQYELEARLDADKELEQGVFDMEGDNDNDKVAPLPARKNSGPEQVEGNAAFEAVSPSDSMSSFDSNGSAPAPPKDLKAVGRRLSNVSDEERDKARQYREGVRATGGPASLADIAKTSFGVSSPPTGNAFGTSPTKFKAGA